MAKLRQRKLWLAVFAILLVFAGCKGESPTAPPTGGGNPPTGGGTAGITIALTASPDALEIDKETVITATVKNNGGAVPDGTAVEFVTTNGTFADTGQAKTVRTTVNGVTTATLTATTKGIATVAATVNNVTRNISVTFREKMLLINVVATPADLQVGDTAAVVATITHENIAVANGTQVVFSTSNGTFVESGGATATVTTTDGVARATLKATTAGMASVTATVDGAVGTTQVNYRADVRLVIKAITPAFGRPSGGETIKITGSNFRGRVRVFFDIGETQPREAMVVSNSDTEINVITPAVNVAAGQQLQAPITVVVDADTASEARVTSATPFAFRTNQLTPNITTISPNSGPPQGGTIVTIFGSNFQAPVQVLFGAAEARILETNFDNIRVQAPAARDTTGTGAEPTTGFVPVTVVNIASATRTSLANGFRYTPAMAITAISPNQGLFTGGTRVTIEGVGLDGNIAVSVAGVAAKVIDARSGTKIIVETLGLDITSCAGSTGPVTVTNIETGITATGPNFIYKVPKPIVMRVNPSSGMIGSQVVVTVANAQPGTNRITLGDKVVFPTAATFNSDGTADFTVTIPTTYTFPTTSCTSGGVAGVTDQPLPVDVTYTNVVTTCTDTATQALTVTSNDLRCRVPPAPVAVRTPASAVMNTVAAAGAIKTDPVSVIISNQTPAGGQTLTIYSATATATNGAVVTVTPSNGTVAPGSSTPFTVTVDPSAAGAYTGTVTFSTNDPSNPTLTFTFSGNAT